MENIPKYIYDDLKTKGDEKVRSKIDDLINLIENEFKEEVNELFNKHKKGYLDSINNELSIEPSIDLYYKSCVSISAGSRTLSSIESYEPFKKEYKTLEKKYERKVRKVSQRVKDKFDEWLLDIWQSGSSDVNIKLPDLDVDISDIIED
jgi:ribosome-associated translation inhibitor RaiA